jgi:hypothetical protein
MPPTYHRRYPGPVTKRGGRVLPVPRPTCLARFVAGTRGFSCAASPRRVPCVAVPRPNSPGVPIERIVVIVVRMSVTLATTKNEQKTNKHEQKRTCPFGNTVTVKFPKTSVSVGSVSGRMHQGSSFGSWLVTRASFCCAQEQNTQEEKKKSRKE